MTDLSDLPVVKNPIVQSNQLREISSTSFVKWSQCLNRISLCSSKVVSRTETMLSMCCRWYKIEDGVSISRPSGAELLITEDMRGLNQYECKAENHPNGQPRNATRKVQFFVRKAVLFVFYVRWFWFKKSRIQWKKRQLKRRVTQNNW